jgi:hypothetical protein
MQREELSGSRNRQAAETKGGQNEGRIWQRMDNGEAKPPGLLSELVVRAKAQKKTRARIARNRSIPMSYSARLQSVHFVCYLRIFAIRAPVTRPWFVRGFIAGSWQADANSLPQNAVHHRRQFS